MHSRLFLHKAELCKLAGFDADRNKKYAPAINLEKVRVSFSLGQAAGSSGAEAGDNLVLYYMPGVSRPANVQFDMSDKIVFGGRSFFVKAIAPLYTDKEEPHHWEITLA